MPPSALDSLRFCLNRNECEFSLFFCDFRLASDSACLENGSGSAQAMLEIIAEVPQAPTLEEGVADAADALEALAPKCEDSVAGA